METLGEKIVAFLPASAIEPQALQQIRNVADLPFIFRHVAVMPDCHLGKGATIGTVMATRGAVIPAAVGVDIGCGMIAVRTDVPEARLRETDLTAVRSGIERRIPASMGRDNASISASAAPRIAALEGLARDTGVAPDRFDVKWRRQLGSLGSGNHFIELAVDEASRVWAVLHSGSRGVGNRMATHHVRAAQTLMQQRGIHLADRDLAWIPDDVPQFERYLGDLHWAQEFARHNRDEMMDRVLTELSVQLHGAPGHEAAIERERIACHHNFAQRETHFGTEVWVTRKGAIQARRGMKAVIPGSMGTRSYIVSGLEHPMAFHSAPHGAGRRFSRGEARRRFTMDDMAREMEGIEYRHARVLLDEIPSAYKDIDEVIERSRELVRVEHTLRQIVNVKGD